MPTLIDGLKVARFIVMGSIVYVIAGCEFHQRHDQQLAGAQATTVQFFLKNPHTYDHIRMRPADLAKAHGTDASEFTLLLPDGRLMSIVDITPAVLEAVAASDRNFVLSREEVGCDYAAHDWNLHASRSARIPTRKPPHILLKPADSESPSRQASDHVFFYLRRVVLPYPEETWREQIICVYFFCFERDKLVQLEVWTWPGDRHLTKFMPAIGKKGLNGDQGYTLPISEEVLTSIFGPILSTKVTG